MMGFLRRWVPLCWLWHAPAEDLLRTIDAAGVRCFECPRCHRLRPMLPGQIPHLKPQPQVEPDTAAARGRRREREQLAASATCNVVPHRAIR